jgi:HPt (histidine-containing phosphotransfer) domain-containing protein
MTNSQSTPFDLNGLYEMYGKDTVQELLQMSVDEARGLLVQIQDGIAERDSKSVMAAAHQLKGLASTMTINELARLSTELEAAARQESWDSIPETKEKLEIEFAQVAKYVSSVLGR